MTVQIDDVARAARLLDAQAKAAELFAAVAERSVIAPGIREVQASDAIRDLAAEMFGVDRYWHKRIVRAGENTLEPYRRNPPDRLIGADDIVFCDFGPIFQDWEADFGRTFVLPDVTGELLFTHMCQLADRTGRTCHWILEVHLVDRKRKIGGFAEELLDLGHTAAAGAS